MMKFIVSFLLLLLSPFAMAITSPGSLLTYEGLLTDGSGNPISSAQVVTFRVLYGSCIVYEETQNITPGSAGEFSAIIGTGSRTDSTGNTADRIFGSSGSVNCEGSGAVSITGFATRSLHIKVGSTDLTPDVTIGNIPMSISSQRLGDKSAADFVQINSPSGVTQSNLESIFARYSNLDSLLTAYVGNTLNAQTAQTSVAFSGSLAGDVAGTQGATSVQKIRGVTVDTTAPTDGQLLKYVAGTGKWTPSTVAVGGGTITALTGDVSASGSGSVAATVNSVGGSSASSIHSAELAANSATNTNTASTLVKRDASGNFSAGTITGNLTGAASLNVLKTGDLMTGNLTFSSTQGTLYTDSGTKTVGIFAPNTIGTSYTLKLPANVAASSGQVLTSDTFGNLSWTTPSTTASSYSGVLPVANGGTGSSTTLSNNRILVSSGGAIVETSALSNGQILIGSTAVSYTHLTLPTKA